MTMAYPLEAGGVDDYPVKVGSMLLTMVDPHKGFEKAYNRWYERDHYYAGCMVGPCLFAGQPLGGHPRAEGPALAGRRRHGRQPHRRRLLRRHLLDRGGPPRRALRRLGRHPGRAGSTPNGRGFAERTHAHTVLFDHVGAVYRDDDPVPVDLALDHGYDGIVVAWFDAPDGNAARRLHAALAATPAARAARGLVDRDRLVVDAVATADAPRRAHGPRHARRRPRAPVPVLLRRRATSRDRSTAPHLHRAVARPVWPTTHLVAPFFRTVVGTDTYVDELW